MSTAHPPDSLPPQVLEEDGIRKAIAGFTWPGIEYGEPPSCPYTFFEYIDALRFGDLERFRRIEAACEGWWFPTLDRGAGAALHFATEHGQLAAVRFLVEQRGAAVNQQDRTNGWTPLLRCARVAHYRHAPFLQVFEYLLQRGADPRITSFPCRPGSVMGRAGQRLGVLDAAVDKGFGWARGQVQAELQRLIDKHAATPKEPVAVYEGPPMGELSRPMGSLALHVRRQWEALPKLYPPANWRPPPPAGFEDAQGMRPHAVEPWRPAGQGDGSAFLRPMTDEELAAQAAAC